MKNPSVAFLIYAAPGTERNALTEEKYKDLGITFATNGFAVSSVSYNDSIADKLSEQLKLLDAILVWVNPIEQGNDRKRLDQLLTELTSAGVFVSTLPEVILKMGTKLVLYDTRTMDWTGEVSLHRNYEDFKEKFSRSSIGSTILKQYRGNGGNGVFNVSKMEDGDFTVVHAQGNVEKKMPATEFFNDFKSFFENDGLLIEQRSNPHIKNGMVRCYVSGNKVAGFGYQEINALYQDEKGNYIPPGKRYYYTESCGLFQDLRNKIETTWIPQLQEILDISDNNLPVIWDVDFFINDPYGDVDQKKYELCEINVSCVSPFPPSAINFMVEKVKARLSNAK